MSESGDILEHDAPRPSDAAELAAPAPQAKRRYPLRFVWRIDAEGGFTVDSEDFAALAGPRTAAALGRTWDDLSAMLELDPDGQVGRALATHDTWSGITVAWPMDDGEPLAVELSGLPVFNRERAFCGYRGFGVSRDLTRLAALAQMRAAATVAPPEAAEPVLPDVSPLPSAADLEPSDSPLSAPPSVAASNLTLVQSSALHELARRLTDRLAAGNSGDGALSTSTVPEAAPEAAIALSDFDLFAEAQAHGATARAITPILDRLPVGVLIYQLSHLLYANRAFLGWAGCKTVEALAEAGGLDSLLIESGTAAFEQDGDQTFTVTTGQGESTPAEGRLFEVPWDGETAYALVTTPAARAALDEPATAPPNPASWTNAEDELIEARRRAEQQSAAKSEFLAKVSHEVRDPLNAIIGFAEIMMEERFGPVGNDRYRQYLKDIHASSAHIMSLVNDLLDLSKIEAGRLELNFAGVALNELVQRCVALMQPQANRERIIIRTSFAPKLPQVMADARSLRQIVLNLLSNSIKFTGAGGQVIISTVRTDAGEVVLHVRDTGIGMSEEELSIALEPFRQVATRAGSGGTGLGLPLTKALAEANGAGFRIDSKPGAGTLVEVTFPRERVMGE